MDKLKQFREDLAARQGEIETILKSESYTPEQRTRLSELNTEVDTLRTDIQTLEVAERNAVKNVVIPGPMPTDGEGKEIKRNFTFTDVLKAGRGERATGFLKEMHDEGVKEMESRGLSSGEGVVLPTKVLQNQKRANQVAGTNNVGGYLVQTDVSGGVIDFLGDKLVLSQMGVMTLDNLQGNVNIPTGTTGLTMTWEGETDEAAETNETFGVVAYTPNRLAGFTNISKQLIHQGNPSIEDYLLREVRRSYARAIQIAALHGNGSGIAGIAGTSGIGSVVGGTDGAAPDWTDIIDLYKEVAVDNADEGNLYYLTNAKVVNKLQATPKQSSGVEGNFVINDIKGLLNGSPLMVSSSVKSNLTKGSSGAVCSAIFFGNFADMGIASWGGLEILFDPFTQAKSGMTVMHVNGYADTNVHRAVSFSAMLDALTT